MKMTALKTAMLSAIVAGSSMMAIAPATAQAGVSANVGAVSNYVFRGLQQTGMASPQLSGGLDYEHDSGVYAGVWASTLYEDDLGENNGGLEYDLYFGWGGEFSGVSVGAGYTNYSYTGDIGDAVEDSFGTFEEINLSVGYGPVSAGYDIGTDNASATELDYGHLYVSFDASDFVPGVSMTYGTFSKDYDGSYFDIGYAADFGGVDLGANVVFSDEDASATGEKQTYFILSASKSFDLM